MYAERSIHWQPTNDCINFSPSHEPKNPGHSHFWSLFDSRYPPTALTTYSQAFRARACKIGIPGSAGCGRQVFKLAIRTSVLAVESDRVLLVFRLDQFKWRPPIRRMCGVAALFPVHIAHMSVLALMKVRTSFPDSHRAKPTADHRFSECAAFTASKDNVTGMSFPDEFYERPWTATTTGISFRTWNWETKQVARRNARFARIDGPRASAPKLQAICIPGTNVARPQFGRGNCNDLSSSQARRIPGSLPLSVS